MERTRTHAAAQHRCAHCPSAAALPATRRELTATAHVAFAVSVPDQLTLLEVCTAFAGARRAHPHLSTPLLRLLHRWAPHAPPRVRAGLETLARRQAAAIPTAAAAAAATAGILDAENRFLVLSLARSRYSAVLQPP